MSPSAEAKESSRPDKVEKIEKVTEGDMIQLSILFLLLMIDTRTVANLAMNNQQSISIAY